MQKELLRCPAYGKLNLFLHVVGRRDDGYHLLETVFQRVDRADFLDFFLRESDNHIILRNPQNYVADPESDLCVRAARLLQQSYQVPYGVEIQIEKNLPVGGGMGGGSSDAATTLMMLNQLWQLNLSSETLQTLGLSLGADVPIFLYGHNAFATGIGEKLTPITLPERYFVVVVPPVHVSTAKIFSSNLLTRETKSIRIADFQATHHTVLLKNDLLPVVFALEPIVKKCYDALCNQVGQEYEVRMTGSGCCLFIETKDLTTAENILYNAAHHFDAFITKALL